MKDSLFREKAYKKALSPEQINDYIKTSKPGVWVMLAAVAILLLGGLVWGVFGRIEMTIDCVAVCKDGDAYCYISEKDADKLSDDAFVRIEDSEYKINDVSQLPVPAVEEISPYGLHLGGLEDDEWVYAAETDAALNDGIYKACVILESVSPISLILN
ncbi:MAG: hypothetical protein IKV63_01065 [Clostridia bacterium]|nr:hypothetical protein [Clostridia bacterium]